jgi:hypothetical protein
METAITTKAPLFARLDVLAAFMFMGTIVRFNNEDSYNRPFLPGHPQTAKDWMKILRNPVHTQFEDDVTFDLEVCAGAAEIIRRVGQMQDDWTDYIAKFE